MVSPGLGLQMTTDHLLELHQASNARRPQSQRPTVAQRGRHPQPVVVGPQPRLRELDLLLGGCCRTEAGLS